MSKKTAIILLACILLLCCFGSSPFSNVVAQDSQLIYETESNSDCFKSVIQTSDKGYAIAGYTNAFGSGGWDFLLIKTDSKGNREWSQTYGGPQDDFAYSVVQTKDGGYALAGYTGSFGEAGWDFCLIKTDSNGNIQWIKTYGGTQTDSAYSVVQTQDGGFALVGYTNSFGDGGNDFLLVKTDYAGEQQWFQTYGGQSDDGASCVIQTADGGYALAGYTSSWGSGKNDFWLVKTDNKGNSQWNKQYGGQESDAASSIVEDSDGGYAILGTTASFGSGKEDFYLVKTDSLGNEKWSQNYGKEEDDNAFSLIRTNNGYTLGGFTSLGGKFWLIKVDALGTILWDQIYGEGTSNIAYSIAKASDEGYVLVGTTQQSNIFRERGLIIKTDNEGNNMWSSVFGESNTYDAKSLVQVGNAYVIAGSTDAQGSGGRDLWISKTDLNAGKYWSKTLGGSKDDYVSKIINTNDGGYALACCTKSFGEDQEKAWFVKTDSLGNILWNKTLGTSRDDAVFDVIQTNDNGFVLCGYSQITDSGKKDLWLIKTDQNGALVWSKTFTGSGNQVANSVIQTTDNGFAVAGFTDSWGAGNKDFWLIKTDALGSEEWNLTFGGSKDDIAFCVIQTTDKGYLISGSSDSYTTDFNEKWVVKTDAKGNVRWSQTYFQPTKDNSLGLSQLNEGNYEAKTLAQVSSQNGFAFALETASFSPPFWTYDTMLLAVAMVIGTGVGIVILSRAKLFSDDKNEAKSYPLKNQKKRQRK